MSIEYHGYARRNNTHLVCDFCGETIAKDTLQEAMDYHREQGWQRARYLVDGAWEWQDACADCVGEIDYDAHAHR